MSAKELEVVCPCCRQRLTVDVASGRVLRSLSPERTDAAGRPVVDPAGWDQALESVRERPGATGNKLSAALDRERTRAQDLEDLFRRARERAAKEPEEGEDAAGPAPEGAS